jgi:hypothetical protein
MLTTKCNSIDSSDSLFKIIIQYLDISKLVVSMFKTHFLLNGFCKQITFFVILKFITICNSIEHTIELHFPFIELLRIKYLNKT